MKKKQLFLFSLLMLSGAQLSAAQGLRTKLTHVVAAMRQGLQSRAADSKEIVRLCAQDPAVKKAGNWLLKAPLPLSLGITGYFAYEDCQMIATALTQERKRLMVQEIFNELNTLTHYRYLLYKKLDQKRYALFTEYPLFFRICRMLLAFITMLVSEFIIRDLEMFEFKREEIRGLIDRVEKKLDDYYNNFDKYSNFNKIETVFLSVQDELSHYKSEIDLHRDFEKLTKKYLPNENVILKKDKEARAFSALDLKIICLGQDDFFNYENKDSSKETKEIIRATLAHELGHLFYNHIQEDAYFRNILLSNSNTVKALTATSLATTGIIVAKKIVPQLLKISLGMPLRNVALAYTFFSSLYGGEIAATEIPSYYNNFCKEELINRFSRLHERQADSFVTKVAHDEKNPSLLDAAVLDYEKIKSNRSIPYPSPQLPLATHPGDQERIDYFRAEAAKLRAKLERETRGEPSEIEALEQDQLWHSA